MWAGLCLMRKALPIGLLRSWPASIPAIIKPASIRGATAPLPVSRLIIVASRTVRIRTGIAIAVLLRRTKRRISALPLLPTLVVVTAMMRRRLSRQSIECARRRSCLPLLRWRCSWIRMGWLRLLTSRSRHAGILPSGRPAIRGLLISGASRLW